MVWGGAQKRGEMVRGKPKNLRWRSPKSPEMVREEPRKGSGMVWEKAQKEPKAQKWSGEPKKARNGRGEAS